MKKTMLSIIAIICLYSMGQAQQKNDRGWDMAAAQISADQGFWVIEHNMASPKKNLVYYYNNDLVLLYKENLDGRKLDISKRKTRLELNKTLVEALANQATHQKQLSADTLASAKKVD